MNEARGAGLKCFLIAGTAAVLLGAIAMRLTIEGWQILGYGWAIPGAVALGGVSGHRKLTLFGQNY